jgi:hypothetical protein
MTDTPPPPGSVSVRMYRGLLGDCFLLTHKVGESRFRALIDCGVLQCMGTVEKKPETKAGTLHIRNVAQDLMRETGGEIDLMIATHEHYDHLSGFILAFDDFQPLKIKSLWVAWTEDRTDALANSFRTTNKGAQAALQKLILEAKAARADAAHPMAAVANDERLTVIENLLQFYGEIDLSPDASKQALDGQTPEEFLAKKPRSCEAVIDWLKLKVWQGGGQIHYLRPGEVVKFGVGEALKAYVLGPPRGLKRLKQLDPSKEGKEVYSDHAMAFGETAQSGIFRLAKDDVSALGGTLRFQSKQDDEAIPAYDRPFSARYSSGQEDRRTFSTYEVYHAAGKEAETRRIDAEWLGSAESLALKIDGDVNNTSLALAMEVPGEDVLLFAADAQVGNWLSWHDQTYPEPAKVEDPKGLTAREILGRVVFYKVGHHASHNATLKELGLELMTDPRLAAMIPVVETVAKEQTSKHNHDGWEMPYGELYERLREKTRSPRDSTLSRILRGDGTPADERTAFEGQSTFGLEHGGGTPANPLWVELDLRYGADARRPQSAAKSAAE